MKKHIPNAITCLNLFFGCLACLAAMESDFQAAFLWIMLAAVFDFLDGFAARLLKAYSPMGKELDSLADMVSFGLAPGFIVFFALRPLVESLPLSGQIPYAYLAFLIPVFSALRLAKFNIDDRQTDSFIGMPTPANTLFWASAIVGTCHHAAQAPLIYSLAVLLLVLVFSFLMVSEIPMFSLKVKNFSWADNKIRYSLVACAILFIALLGWAGVAAAIVLYLSISLVLYFRGR